MLIIQRGTAASHGTYPPDDQQRRDPRHTGLPYARFGSHRADVCAELGTPIHRPPGSGCRGPAARTFRTIMGTGASRATA